MNRSVLLPTLLALPCHAGLLVYESFDYPAPVNDVWISFLWRLPESNSLYEGVNFYLGDDSIFAVSNSSTSTSSAITLNDFATGVDVAADGGEFGETHFIVLHLIEGGGTSGGDRVEMFLDPPLTGPESAPDEVVQGTEFAFERVRMAGQAGASLTVDELRIGDEFEDIAPFLFPETDPDGDGLPTDVELELGLDPNVSDAELIQAIRDHPELFGLHDSAGIRDPAGGGVVLEGDEGAAELIFEIQQSTDLSTWLPFETVRLSIILPSGKNFLQFRPAAPAAP